MNDSADFVMYWWDHAAELLTRNNTPLRRFGLVTTNSISQVFQRRVMERHLTAKAPISLVMAVPDHPWTKSGLETAAVRIAMTVAEAGAREGVLREVTREEGLDTDAPLIELREEFGPINSDLTVGIDVTLTKSLSSNDGLSCPGVKLHGAGFIVTLDKAKHLGLGQRAGLEKHVRDYRNGRDLTARSRGVLVIDLFGLDANDVRERYPEVYQHLVLEVKQKTTLAPDGTVQYAGRDWNKRGYRRENWWLFGENNPELRKALSALKRYIVTVETTKHRVFQFLDASILPDNMLIAIASDDGFTLGVLSARIHGLWAVRAGGWLGMGNDPRYSKSRCFDTFPFPLRNDISDKKISAIAEDLDAHRKRVLAEHPHLTLTGLYNVLEKLRAGIAPDALPAPDRRIFDDGLVLILKEYHDNLDNTVAATYGWPADLPDTEILARLVALNAERAREESEGLIRWLRPEYQIPRFGSAKDKLALTGGAMREAREAGTKGKKPLFPADNVEQTAAVMAALAALSAPLGAEAMAARFRQGRRVLVQVSAVLAALARMGFVASPDGGRTYALRRTA